MNIYSLERDNDIKGISVRKRYIETLIAKTIAPDVIVLPELALCSYMGSTDIWQYADIDSADTSKWAMAMAEKYHTYIAVGYLEKNDGNYYNSYLIADNNRVYGIVRKSEGEAFIFKRGDFSHTIHTPLGNIAVAICYDARRKHFYDKIKDETISLILFPHGSPGNPKDMENEQQTIDYFCMEYQKAFDVPVVYTNSKGKLDYMMGKTGKMMMQSGFCLNGMSAIYTSDTVIRSNNSSEIHCWSGNITPQVRKKDIDFVGEDVIGGNWLFRKFVLQPDIRYGIKFYENAKKKNKEIER